MIEKEQLEQLFEMSSGYVLEFSNREFKEFIRTTVGIDIYDARYAAYGESKANRLRTLWQLAPDDVVGKVLAGLIEYWEYKHPQPDAKGKALVESCRSIVTRLSGRQTAPVDGEKQFLDRDLSSVSLKAAVADATLLPILESRLSEATRCLQNDAPLAAIFLCGSILEGLLLGAACAEPKKFNQAPNSPKDDTGKVKLFQHWKLSEFIEVAHEVRCLSLDVKKFSHAMRDFRNYIHPYQQMRSQFDPDKHTAEICLQVLRAAIACLEKKRN
jgi:hypothetical protein